MKTYLPMIAVATLAIGGIAHAVQTAPATPPAPPAGMAPPPPPPGGGRGDMAFERMDANDDGKITRAEYDAVSAQRFQRMDANGDGVIDKAEMAPRRGMGRRPGPND